MPEKMRELADKLELADAVEKLSTFTPSLSSSRVFPTEHGNWKGTSCPLFILHKAYKSNILWVFNEDCFVVGIWTELLELNEALIGR